MNEACSIRIFVDADACPVKPEVYRVAERHRLRVYVVANSPIQVPRDPLVERVTVGSSLDAAVNAIEELEETARLYLLLRGAKTRFLTPAQVAELMD